MAVRIRWLLIALLCLQVAACSEQPMGPPRQETFPVTGEVIVDGQPADNLRVQLHELKGGTEPSPGVLSEAYTDSQGKFAISTYEQADGVPEGDYAVTFFWGEMNVLSRTYGGPDKLKNKHDDPKKSSFKIKVEKGKATDMGRVELQKK